MLLNSGRRVGLGLMISVFTALPAYAQEQTRVGTQSGGMDTHLFRAAVDSKGFITVNGTNILGDGNISLGLVLDYGHSLLRTNNGDTAVDQNGNDCSYGKCDNNGNQFPANDTQGVKALIEHSFQGEFAFNYGIANKIVVGLKVPVVLMTGDPAYRIGPNPELGGGNYNTVALDQESIHSLSLHAKWRITRVEKTIGLALIGQVGLPVSDANKNLGGDPGVWYWPELAVEHRFGQTGLRIGLNGGYRGHSGENAGFGSATLKEGAVRHGNLGTFNAALGWRATDALDLIAETYGTYLLDSDSASAQKLSQEVIGGIKLFVEKNSFLMLGGGARLFSTGYQAADQRLFLGFIFEPSIGDRDGDGYLDDEDQCPDEPEDFDNFEDEDGCPDPDNDKDGILDVDDRCINIPEDHDGDHDEDGCPEGTAEKDRDHDGIYDSKDKCPDQPEDVDSFEDQDGCPDPDNDKDGILDVDDQCPFDPEDKDGFEDEDGCPDPDNDKDQILDVNDKCPNEPETYNGTDDEDGCPDKGKVIIQGNDVMILEKIAFETDSAEIMEKSFGIISAVVSTLNHHPEFKLIEVAGHADERSTDEHNLRLTQARAASVMKALSERGIDSKRLVSQGYGEYCPLDDSSNPTAWEKNRRVEFKIVKTDTGSTGVARGCDRARSRGVLPPSAPDSE
ncbi:MAG TPA: OmpA family protein [Polyangiaceae bacterium]|jgi:outer membrane protein OmpA-like peptidoglycan-associated protein|nr:OmpA family protein [Polyangiaceae bacterium]